MSDKASEILILTVPLRLRPVAEMAFQNGFEFFLVFLRNANPGRRQYGERAADVQTQDRLRRTHRKHCELAGFGRAFPLISLDIEPGDRATAVKQAAVPHFEIRQDDQRVKGE